MYSKVLEESTEDILFPDMPIIDAHTHLFDNINARYIIEDYLKNVASGHNIVASVCIEIQAFVRDFGPVHLRPLGEVEFLNGMAAIGASRRYGKCLVSAAIVGYADLRQGDIIGDYLDQAMACAPNRFRGVRQLMIEHESEVPYRYITHRPPKGLFEDKNFYSGIKQLDQRCLSFDIAVFHNQLPHVIKLADAFPNMSFILNHIGMPMLMAIEAHERAESFNNWQCMMHDLAKRKNVTCKVGGLGLPFFNFGLMDRKTPITSTELASIWKPYIDVAINAFSPMRCMMESNFPPDGRSVGFSTLWNTLKLCTAEYNDTDKHEMFYGTAKRIYKINSL